MARAVDLIRPHVENYSIKMKQFVCCQFGWRRNLFQARRAFKIFCGALWEIHRNFWLVRSDDLNKLVLTHRLQCVVELPLIPERGPSFFRKRFAAKRTRTVSGI